jgi:hypothetical protein
MLKACISTGKLPSAVSRFAIGSWQSVKCSSPWGEPRDPM